MSISDRLDQIEAGVEHQRESTHAPWHYTEFGVLCSCGLPMRDEECPHIDRDIPALVAALRAVLAECEDREEVPEDSGSGADAARDIRRMIAAALGEES